MTTSTATIERTDNSHRVVNEPFSALAGDLYRYHGMRVFDSEGERVGIVDWIWANEHTGAGDHVGLQLQWLRGKARAVSMEGAVVDRDLQIVALPFTKREIDDAPRFRIDRPLSPEHRIQIAAHFAPPLMTPRSVSLVEQVAA
ncbi:MAG TPA: PRC-barrel domain-containing protein [Chloroflexota bacterium]